MILITHEIYLVVRAVLIRLINRLLFLLLLFVIGCPQTHNKEFILKNL